MSTKSRLLSRSTSGTSTLKRTNYRSRGPTVKNGHYLPCKKKTVWPMFGQYNGLLNIPGLRSNGWSRGASTWWPSIQWLSYGAFDWICLAARMCIKKCWPVNIDRVQNCRHRFI